MGVVGVGEDRPALNTDRELYREPKGDLPSDYYANSLHVTIDGRIGMDVGGNVYCMPIRDWHALAHQSPAAGHSPVATLVPDDGSESEVQPVPAAGPPAVPDPTVEALRDEIARVIPAAMTGLPRPTIYVEAADAVIALLAARAAAPDALTPTTLAEALHEHRTASGSKPKPRTSGQRCKPSSTEPWEIPMTGATELTEYERQAVQRDANVSLVMLLDTVQRIKAEAAAAPDALRVAVEALAAEWGALASDTAWASTYRITWQSCVGQLRALLEDDAQ